MHRATESSPAARRASAAAALVVIAALIGSVLASAPAVTAQDAADEFPLPGSESLLQGFTRSDGTVVLADADFCRFLLGSLWGSERLTRASLINRSRQQRPARRAAFVPAHDEATITRCAEAVSAFRLDPPEGDTIAAWARRSPVMPESLARLLPPDTLTEAGATLGSASTSGFGSLTSAPFALDADAWLAQVHAVDCPEWSGALTNVRDGANRFDVAGIRQYLYGVAPGHYFWEVTASDCDWSVDLVPVDLGPDPTSVPGPGATPEAIATPVPRVPVPRLHGTRWERRVGAPNEDFLTATQARQALLDAGLTVGQCIDQAGPARMHEGGRVWNQVPEPGTVVDAGSPVDVYIHGDCDIVLGDRVET